jgi:hypothetical protein
VTATSPASEHVAIDVDPQLRMALDVVREQLATMPGE